MGARKFLGVAAQDCSLVGINQHPAAVHKRRLPPFGVKDLRDPLVDGALERFRLGDKGQVLIHARDPVKAQRLLDQNIRRVGAGVQRIVQPQGDRMFPGDLLGIAQHGRRLNAAVAIAVVAVDLEVFCIFRGQHEAISFCKVACLL